MQYLPLEVLSALEQKLGRSTVNNWLRCVQFKSDDPAYDFVQPTLISEQTTTSSILTVLFPSIFVQNWVKSNYGDVICQTLRSVYTKDKVKFAVDQGINLSKYSMQLNPTMNFGNLITSNSNKTAYQVANNIDSMPSIIIISANHGNGKTHLAQAIAWEYNKLNKSVCYINLNHNDLYFTLKHSEKLDFSDAELLIIDNLECLTSIEKNNFGNAIRRFIATNKKLILCTTRDNLDISKLKVNSASSIYLKLDEPDYELRYNFLYSKTNITKEKISYFAIEHAGSMDELNQLISMGLEQAERALRGQNPAAQVSIREVIAHVAQAYGIKPTDLYLPNRQRHIVNTRQVIMFICKVIFSKGLREIGNFFGYTDHTSVLYGIKQVQSRILIDLTFGNEVCLIRGGLRSCQK